MFFDHEPRDDDPTFDLEVVKNLAPPRRTQQRGRRAQRKVDTEKVDDPI